jgi:hypothetical protein
MPLLSLDNLDNFATRSYGPRLRTKSASSILEEESKRYPLDHKFDIFLSHSFSDAHLSPERVLKLKAVLEAFNYEVYVDWLIDSHLNRNAVTPTTAHWLRVRMDSSKCLFFATSESSQNSRWMPWELGYKDGNTGKGGQVGMVAILPISQYQNQTTFTGQEYLGIYPFTYYADDTSGKQRFWISQNGNSISLDAWLAGAKP